MAACLASTVFAPIGGATEAVGAKTGAETDAETGADGAGSAERLYCKLPLSEGLQGDIDDVASCLPRARALGGETRFWMSSSGVETPLHFDHCHSVIAQVVGTKRLVVFPPSESTNLYPYSVADGNPRTSRIDLRAWLAGGDENERRRWPRVDSSYAYECVLQPGDIAYIPTGWWHYLVSISASISVLSPFDMSPAEQRQLHRPWTRADWGLDGGEASIDEAGELSKPSASSTSTKHSTAGADAGSGLALCVRGVTGRSVWTWCFAGSELCDRLHIRPAIGKGLGAFASRRYAPGDVLFVERPLLRWWQLVDGNKSDNLARLTSAHAQLTPKCRTAYDALMQNARAYGVSKCALGIFLSNAYPCAEEEEEEALANGTEGMEAAAVSAAVFASISRLNHACRPNTVHSWSHGCGARVVSAVAPIDVGDELVCTYLGMQAVEHPRELRRAYLDAKFDFECQCTLCDEQHRG